MDKQQKLTNLQSQHDRNLKDMAIEVHHYLSLLETGPILKGLTDCLESYIRRDLVNHVAQYGKEDLDEPIQTIGVMMETITLIGVLKDFSDMNEMLNGEMIELRGKIQRDHD